jgi:alkylation response protein AidB-like acyl-CoA dehydrogenase
MFASGRTGTVTAVVTSTATAITSATITSATSTTEAAHLRRDGAARADLAPMDFDMPPEDHPARTAVREWIADNPDPTGREMADAGYVVPHWPAPWGLEAGPLDQLIIDEELAAAGIRRPSNAIGIGWAAPTILLAGTDEQKWRYLPGIFSGDEFWCQLFSEPEAGSDLANLATRAELDGDEYIVNGSKIWSSGAHHSELGILIARTDPDQPKHKGISYFICPMDSEGISMSPIVDMTTAHSFNQVFFDNVRIPASLRVGDEGDGWRLAKVTLSNERVSLSAAGSLWGVGPSAEHLLDLARAEGGIDDPVLRDRAASLHIESELLRLNRMRSLSATLQGKTPGPEASIQKIMADEHGQHVMALAKDLAGTDGMLTGSGPAGVVPSAARAGPTENNLSNAPFPSVHPVWHYGYLFHPALTLGGGTFAVQRNIVAEHVLGLPREPNLEKGLTWSEARRPPSAA